MQTNTLMLLLFFVATSLQGSQNLALTQEELRISKEQQAMIISSIPEKIEIGTIDAVHTQIDQAFIYGHMYKGVGLREFFEKHSHIIDDFKQFIELRYQLDTVSQLRVCNILKQNSDARDIQNYILIGNKPLTFCNDRGVEENDALFNITQAKKEALEVAKNYIKNNYKSVYVSCYEAKLNNEDSHKVLCVPCCQKQFHKKCLVNCKIYNIKACPNVTCQIAENGQHYQKNWDNHFYEALFMSSVLSRKQIDKGSCLLCEESLKKQIQDISLSTQRKRSLQEIFVSSDKKIKK